VSTAQRVSGGQGSPSGNSKEARHVAGLLGFIKKLHDKSVELLSDVRFNVGLRSDRLILGTYASLIEFCGATVTLVDANGHIAVPLVFRSFLEAYVHFINATNDENYVNHYEASHHEHWIKVLKERDEPNPFLAEIHSHAERANKLKEHEDELARLKGAGFGPLLTRDRFQRAGQLDVYQSVYLFESDAVHTSLQALLERHHELTEGRLELTLYKERPLDEFMARLDGTAAGLLDATQKVHDRYKSGRTKDVGALSEEFAKLRAAY
jgi:hypothetical protein